MTRLVTSFEIQCPPTRKYGRLVIITLSFEIHIVIYILRDFREQKKN